MECVFQTLFLGFMWGGLRLTLVVRCVAAVICLDSKRKVPLSVTKNLGLVVVIGVITIYVDCEQNFL